MTAEEYQNTLRICAMTAGLIGEHDIPKMLEMIERADSIGGMIYPTLYREKHGAMMEDKELLKAALPLWRMAKKFKEKPSSELPRKA
jgi:hypothetical protein